MPDIEAREAFPKILAAYMASHNMKQADVARNVHVSKQIVSDWLRGKKFPRVDKMQELADMFGVLMSDMYTPRSAGVELKVNGSRKSFIGTVVKATVKNPDAVRFEDINFDRDIQKLVFKDAQTQSMMKLWEVATPEAKSAAIGVLKTLNKVNKKENKL